MIKKKIIHFLQKNYSFFSDFTDAELLKIFNISKKKNYRKGEVIIKEGTVGNLMYIIILGEVVITKKFSEDEDSLLDNLKVGDIIGEMAIVDESPRYATATAQSDAVLIAINEVILRNDEPRLCLKLYKNLSSMLSEKLKRTHAMYRNKK